MKNAIAIETGLHDEDIDRVSESCVEFLSAAKATRADAVRTRISVENAMLAWKDSLGEEAKVSMTCSRRFGKSVVSLSCAGAQCDPFADSDDMGEWSRSILKSMGRLPSYEYAGGANRVRFTVERRKAGFLLLLLLGVVVGIVAGLAGTLVPEATRLVVCESYLTPVYTTYLNVFALCGIPLIFLSVLTGILGVGNIGTFSSIGRKMNHAYMSVMAVVTAIAFAFAMLFMFPRNWTAGMDFQNGSVLSILLDMFPTGLFTPFLDCSAPQLIILGLVFGVGLLILGREKGALSSFMFDVQDLLLLFSKWLAALIPIFIAICLTNTIWSSSLTVILSSANMFVLTVGLQVAFTAVLALAVSLRHKVPFAHVVRKTLNVFLISAGTNSCGASIPDNYDCCAKMGISPKVFSFGIPIGTTVFKPATAIRLVVMCFFYANEYGVSVSFGWLFLLFILTLCLSVACPAIPGGVLIICSSLFTSMNIPAEAMTAMLATDVFFDFICTGINQIAVPLMLTLFSGRLGLLDESKLKK